MEPISTPSSRGVIVAFPESAIVHRPAPAPARRFTWVWALLATLLVVVFAMLGSAWWAARRVSNSVGHLNDAFPAASVPRPARPAAAGESLNILVAGLDGECRSAWERGTRSDALMLVHLDADRSNAWVTSLPRDAWVTIPEHGTHKINAAYSLGGPLLSVRTVESLTGVHVDHVVVVDWTGLRRLADASGGVAVDLLPPRDSSNASVALEMSGDVVLPYVSERKHLPNGDLDRIKRQHHFLRAFVRQSLDRGLLSEPARIRDLAMALGEAVRVDAGLGPREMLALATSLRGLRDENVHFLTAPVTGPGQVGDASVLWLDEARGRELWEAMAHDRMGAFAARNVSLATAERVR
jgi:LCP family protein required for cell wall assembly